MVSVSSFLHSYRGPGELREYLLLLESHSIFISEARIDIQSDMGPSDNQWGWREEEQPYHLLGDQSLTVVLSRADFPFPSRGHMVILKTPLVTVAMTVSRSLPLEGNDEGHDWTSTVHAKVPHQKEFTYPKHHQHQGSGTLVYFFCGLSPFLQNQTLFNTSWYLISYKKGTIIEQLTWATHVVTRQPKGPSSRR